jgi:hypothetical protein
VKSVTEGGKVNTGIVAFEIDVAVAVAVLCPAALLKKGRSSKRPFMFATLVVDLIGRLKSRSGFAEVDVVMEVVAGDDLVLVIM